MGPTKSFTFSPGFSLRVAMTVRETTKMMGNAGKIPCCFESNEP